MHPLHLHLLHKPSVDAVSIPILCTTPSPDLLLQQQQAQISMQHQQHLQRGIAQLQQDHSPYGGPQHQQDAVMQDLQNQQTALSDQQLLHMQTQGLTAEQIQHYQAHLDASQQRGLQPSQFNSAPPVLFHTEPPRRHYRPQHGARGDDASSFASDDFDALRNSDSVGEAGDPTGSSSPSPEQGGFGPGQPQAFTGHQLLVAPPGAANTTNHLLVPPLQLSAARGTVIDNYTDDQRGGPHVDTARSSAASSGFAPSSAGGGGLVSVSRRGSLNGVEGTMTGHGEDGALAPLAPGGGGLVPQPRAKSWKELHVEARPAPAHIVVFDWDDTLLPTWYIGNVVLPCVTGLKFCSMVQIYSLRTKKMMNTNSKTCFGLFVWWTILCPVLRLARVIKVAIILDLVFIFRSGIHGRQIVDVVIASSRTFNIQTYRIPTTNWTPRTISTTV